MENAEVSARDLVLNSEFLDVGYKILLIAYANTVKSRSYFLRAESIETEMGVSMSTAYKKINELVGEGDLKVSGGGINENGRKFRFYKITESGIRKCTDVIDFGEEYNKATRKG